MNKGRKISGAKYHSHRKKKLYERHNQARVVTMGKETRRKSLRVRGGSDKILLLTTNKVNLVIDGKVKKAEITNVEETPQNRFFARQNRLMKGALIETTLGKARITNRPSQEGMVNAVLIKK
jgi:small subunit ribosomal protein S8e